MSSKGTLQLVAEHVTRAFGPIVDAVSSPSAFEGFMLRLGWNFTSVPQEYVDFAVTVSQAITVIDNLGDDLDPAEVEALFTTASALYTGAVALPPPSGVDPLEFAAEIGRSLFDLLLVDYLARNLPRFLAWMRLFGLVELEVVEANPATPLRPSFVATRVRYDRLARYVGDPTLIPAESFGWGSDDFRFGTLAEMAFGLFDALGFKVRRGRPVSQEVDGFLADGAVGPSSAFFTVVFGDVILGADAFDISVTAIDAPREGAHLPGVVVRPSIPALSAPLQIGENLSLSVSQPGSTQPFGVVLRPLEDPTVRFPFESDTGGTAFAVTLSLSPAEPIALIGRPDASRISVKGAAMTLGFASDAKGTEVRGSVEPQELAIVIKPSDADGFLGKLLGDSELKADVDLNVAWSSRTGISISGGVGFRIELNPALEIGSVRLDRLAVEARAAIGTADPGVVAGVLAGLTARLGPVTVVVDGIGVSFALTFTEGRAGRYDTDLGFQPPKGVGIAIKAGPVSGGGFVFIDEPAGRYFGALELSVYNVAVKAFGLIETKFPDGHRGFSFLIIISAEFTPIQLGFGFTLNGVGGLAGINRTIDTDALLATVRRGTVDHLLFPEDPVKDAPSIAQELGAIFPAAEGHYVFGPLAKIGWGTPTLIEARIGLVIEFPGPRLLVLGTVRAALPKPDAPLVLLNLDVAGVLDFPKKYFSLDASLHDSKVGEFPITGDMAMRLTWGNNPNFAFAIGGFNPHFTPPSSFPKLRPATVDLGVQGNPSITLSGYFALTSNTAQTGAKLEARVSRGGANLYGFLGFDAIFVFSPFSFMGDVEGGVDVNFHGYGFSLHFHGHVQGPTPWKLDGQVCVSILFWDACVGFSVTLGGEQRVSLPGLDPWLGSPAAERSLAKQEVPGLSQALETTANWTGGLPTGAFAVATLIEAAPGTQTPVDPLGSATFRQKAVPLGIDVTRFAGTKPSVARNFKVQSATIGQEGQGTGGATVTVKDSDLVKDFFAPAQYIEMKDADKLSHPSFDLMDAGFTVSSNVITSGTAVIHPFKYDTTLFSATAAPQTIQEQYDPSNTHIAAVAGRSATAFGGIRLTGLSRFIDLPFFARARLINETYGVTNIGTLGGVSGFPLGVSKSAALSALFAAKATNPFATRTLQVTPSYNFRPA